MNDSSGLQKIGSWYAHDPFAFRGWRKPVKFVSTPLIADF